MKIRIISAVVALAILIPLLCLGGIPFAIGMGILSVLAYKEAIDLKKAHAKIPNLMKILGLISLLYLVLGDFGINTLGYAVNYSRILLPLVVMLIPTIFYKKDKYKTTDAFYLIGFIYLIGMVFNLFIVLRGINVYLLVYLLGITILTDTFAYLIGCLIGKHKMAPLISPNKSWEGAIAGCIGGVTISSLIYANLIGTFNIKVLFLTILLSIVGQIGDLVFSKIKRENEIKDFSNIMPGHGGILDRIDSLAFVVLVYTIIVWFI